MTLYFHPPAAEPYAVAINYEPDEPPPVGILADWIRAAGSEMKPSVLRDALKTGTPVVLGDGRLEWRDE